MDRMRAWGFAVGLLIAWFIGFAVAATRLGEAHRGQSTFVGAAHSSRESARGHFVR
jgi:hypothetical protein